MTEFIVITAITTAVFMIISISYKIGHLDGQLKELKEINKMLVDMKKKRRLEMLSGQNKEQEDAR